MEYGITDRWFSDARLPPLWSLYVDMHVKHGRAPTQREFAEQIIAREEPDYARANHKAIKFCLESASEIGIDICRSKLKEWAKARVLVNHMTDAAAKFNAGLQTEALEVAEKMINELRDVESVADLPFDAAETSDKRVETEKEQRMTASQNMVPYGISFLDDVLEGIPRSELILIGADTGVGKTELATRIARHVAQQGKRVTYFALEADKNEIEQRIKWEKLATLWRKDHGDRSEQIEYTRWIYGKEEDEVGKYEAEVDKWFAENMKTLKTYYRIRDDFTPQTLKREFKRLAKTTDLFILDHFHYVDLAGENENREQMELIQTMRHLVLALGVPMICIVHLKKKAGKAVDALVPALDEIHGSSNLAKIAKSIVMISKAYDLSTSDTLAMERLPTYFSIRKFRNGGSRQTYTAICLYNPESGSYEPVYQLGRLMGRDTKWVPMPVDKRPKWAKHYKDMGFKMENGKKST